MTDEPPARTPDEARDVLSDEATREGLNLYLRMLQALAGMGMHLAASVTTHTQAKLDIVADGGWTPDVGPEPGAGFVRLSQAVRRTIAMDLHIRERLAPGQGNPFSEQVTVRGPPNPILEKAPRERPTYDAAADSPRAPREDDHEPKGRAAFLRELGPLHDTSGLPILQGDLSLFQAICIIGKQLGLDMQWARYDPETCTRRGMGYEPRPPWTVKPLVPTAGLSGYRVFADRTEVINDDVPRETGPPTAGLH